MAISLTLRIRAFLLITLIILTFSKRCISHPKLTLRLIHTKSIKPQESLNRKNGYFRSKSTPVSRLDNLWTTETADIVSHVTPIPNPAAFLANISIGDPPIPQLLLIDTGSDLTWIQCLPCKCYPQTIPFFHPSRSSTYRNASCEAAPHAMPQIFRDEKTGNCRYHLRYRDFSSTGGVLAKEKLTFQTSDDGIISKPNIIFGCGQDNSDNSGFTQSSGVLGLGPGKFSIVTNYFSSRFSYCFGSLTDPTYPHNILILGDGAKTEGDPTPLEIYKDRYYLELQAISLGEKLLDIEPGTFQRYGSEGGTVIDTGCSPTILARVAYETLSEEIDILLGEVLRRVKDWEPYTNPCYEGNLKLDLYGFPVVTFHFADGAELALDVESLFVSSGSGDSFCLAMTMDSFDDMSVIGAMAQQNYNVGYDLRAMKVYFQRTDCEVLDS
ncbi:Aspartyl protease UND [Cardamine amara subsp. amara]|uniref:Aspartyl protease UND n=1 Tax=Cardamine amara subsp. amara TaxID=228776 RepID=A0ABD1AV11_CARAN